MTTRLDTRGHNDVQHHVETHVYVTASQTAHRLTRDRGMIGYPRHRSFSVSDREHRLANISATTYLQNVGRLTYFLDQRQLGAHGQLRRHHHHQGDG